MDVTNQKLLIDSQREELSKCYEMIELLQRQKSILLKDLHEQVVAENKKKLSIDPALPPKDKLRSNELDVSKSLDEWRKNLVALDKYTPINVGDFGCPKDENGKFFEGNKIYVVFKDCRLMTTAYPSEMGFWDLHPSHPRRPTHYKIYTE